MPIEIFKINDDSFVIEAHIVEWAVLQVYYGKTSIHLRRKSFSMKAKKDFGIPLDTDFRDSSTTSFAPHLYKRICDEVACADRSSIFVLVSMVINYDELLNLIGAFNLPYDPDSESNVENVLIKLDYSINFSFKVHYFDWQEKLNRFYLDEFCEFEVEAE